MANGSPATHRTLRQSSYTPNSTAVQLHTELYGSPATHRTLRQSSYTPNSLYGSPATHRTLRQSSYTPNSTAVQLHTELYCSPATHRTIRQSSYTPNSTAAERNWRERTHSSCRLDSQCSGDREEEELANRANRLWVPKLQALVYDILPPTIAIANYAIMSRKFVS